MPHIHTEPGQHDLTTSAYIVREVDGEWKCLLHMHKKLHKLLQVGGHVELHETLWQALAHELQEEAGYSFDELRVLQPNDVSFESPHYVVHPVPLTVNTHKFSHEHYHTDIAYGFVAGAEPNELPHDGESSDVRWLSIAEMEQARREGSIILDVLDTYKTIVETCLKNYVQAPATRFSLAHPTVLPAEQT